MSDEEQEWTPAFPGQRPPFQPGHELSMKHGAHSEREIREVLPETQQEVTEAQEEIARALGEVHSTAVPKADTLLGHRLARTMAKLKLFDRYEDAVMAAFQARLDELKDPAAIEAAYTELLEKLGGHAKYKGQAETLLLKQFWAAGLGEMAQARVAEARSAADARNPQPRGREAQQRALRIVNGEVVPGQDPEDG